MAFRELPPINPGDPLSARKMNDTNWNVSRLARMSSGGAGYYDCTAGRFTGGGGNPMPIHIGFEVVSFNETYGIATCYVTYRPFGFGAVPGEDQYGQVQVYDEMLGCVFDETEDALVGRRGVALFVVADHAEDPYSDPKWQCLSLCCAT